MTYTAVVERAKDGTWAAYVPDLPTILAMGDTLDELKQSLHDGIQLWIEEEREDGRTIPPPSAQSLQIDIAA